MTKSNAVPARLRRDESFLGLHFDFHANDDCTEIGRNVTPAMIRRIITKVKPDYIQCDCKGHRGLSSYPTKVGNPAPGFIKDQLCIWRDVTAKHGVALFMHYSGVSDVEAIKQHPSWARVDENGKRDKENTSVFGSYVDKLLIPQLKELSDVYGVDGVWIDGDCWAAHRDYSRKALKLFKDETGITSIPRKPEDPYMLEFIEFCRNGFRKYLNNYVTALHEHNPEFQICSNWAFSSFMPESIAIDVDFISGDYPMANSVNFARMEGRCMMHQGKPWDLMAWSFISRWNDDEMGCFSTKSVPQMQQEAATVLALGGGFQFYFTQKRDGSIYEWQMDLMAEVAAFCRERQQFCHNTESVPQIALLYPGEAYYKKSPRLFRTWNNILDPMRGIMQCLLDSQNIVDITMSHQITGCMNDYPLIVLPEWDYLNRRLKKELLEYVKAGGNLLVIGPKAASLFKKQLGVRYIGKEEKRHNWLSNGKKLCALYTACQKVKCGDNVKSFGKIYAENDFTGPSIPAASITGYGKGKIAAVYLDLGERYCNARTTVVRDFLGILVRKLFSKPLVEMTGSHNVDVMATCLDGKLMINLVNISGPHGDENVYVFDEIPTVGPLHITIRIKKKPGVVTLQPGNRILDWIYSKGEVKLTLSGVDIHDIIVLD